MSRRPVVGDFFCGAGGAGMGYHLAGFDVVGFDIVDQPNYPFEFRRMNALTALTMPEIYEQFDLIHTSPPCQASSALTKGTNKGRKHVDLIPATRELLKLTGKPFVIENVQGARVRRDLTLCGEMFDLEVLRHRYFEIEGLSVTQPQHKPHRGRVQGWRHGKFYDGPYFAVYGDGGGKGTVAEWQRAMGMDWTDVRLEIAEAIPPAYTYDIGKQIIGQFAQEAAA